MGDWEVLTIEVWAVLVSKCLKKFNVLLWKIATYRRWSICKLILSGRHEEKKMKAMAIFYVTELEAK